MTENASDTIMEVFQVSFMCFFYIFSFTNRDVKRLGILLNC